MREPNNAELCYYKKIIKAFKNDCKPKGWRRFISKVREMDSFYNTEKSLVVKRFALILEPNTPSKLCVHTFELGGGWVVQPLVKKIRLKKAVDILQKELNNYPNLFPDLHTQNGGWLRENGKMVPKMFDW